MKEIIVGGRVIAPGTTTQIELPVAKLYTDTDVNMPIHIVRGRKDGPTLFVSAAIHGDELNGIEIIRRIIKLKTLKVSTGTLILVPIVNVYGVLNQSRYMPDRRDLNRSFPGSAKGSLAGRVAHRFLTEIVEQCDYGIDLHTGAIHRTNIPHIRANLDDEATLKMAEEFGVAVLLNSNLRDGSLREAAVENDTKILLYEAGEALRFDEYSIRAGVKGVVNVLSHLGMVKSRKHKRQFDPFVAFASTWVRANASGIVRNLKRVGSKVQKGEVLAEIGSPFGDVEDVVKAVRSGILIGKQNIPLVQEGDAMFHIAYFKDNDEDVAETIENLSGELFPDLQSMV